MNIPDQPNERREPSGDDSPKSLHTEGPWLPDFKASDEAIKEAGEALERFLDVCQRHNMPALASVVYEVNGNDTFQSVGMNPRLEPGESTGKLTRFQDVAWQAIGPETNQKIPMPIRVAMTLFKHYPNCVGVLPI